MYNKVLKSILLNIHYLTTRYNCLVINTSNYVLKSLKFKKTDIRFQNVVRCWACKIRPVMSPKTFYASTVDKYYIPALCTVIFCLLPDSRY